MKRVIALAVVFLFVAAAAAHAQEPLHSSKAPAGPAAGPQSGVFSKAAIEKAVAKTVAADTAASAPRFSATPAPRVPRSGKNFFKTPWPYLIAGGVIAGVIIAVNSGSSGSGGMSGY